MLAQHVSIPQAAGPVVPAPRRLGAIAMGSFLSGLTDIGHYVLVAPMERHLQRKAALHTLLGFTDHHPGDCALTRSNVATMSIGAVSSRCAQHARI